MMALLIIVLCSIKGIAQKGPEKYFQLIYLKSIENSDLKTNRQVLKAGVIIGWNT